MNETVELSDWLQEEQEIKYVDQRPLFTVPQLRKKRLAASPMAQSLAASTTGNYVIHEQINKTNYIIKHYILNALTTVLWNTHTHIYIWNTQRF